MDLVGTVLSRFHPGIYFFKQFLQNIESFFSNELERCVFFGPAMLGDTGWLLLPLPSVSRRISMKHRFLMMLASGFVGNDEEFVNLQAF